MVKEMFGLTRYIAHMDVGAPNHEVMMKSIELFGTKVAGKSKINLKNENTSYCYYCSDYQVSKNFTQKF